MPRTHFVCGLSFILLVSLHAAPAISTDLQGVTVALNGFTLLHRAPVQYPASARKSGVQGTVIVEATLDDKGTVADARVLSGPAELRRASLESVLQWHFARDAAGSTRQVTIQFDLPPQPNRATPPDFFPSLIVLQRAPAGPIGLRVHRIEILGLPEEPQNQLRARLPLHEGDVLSQELADATGRAVREFDEHLNLGFVGSTNTESNLQIVAPGYEWPSPPRPILIGPPQINGRAQ